MSMTRGSNGGKGREDAPPPRPPSQQSSGSSSGGSKHLKCIGRYVLTGHTLGKGNFARVEAAVHTLTRAKVSQLPIQFLFFSCQLVIYFLFVYSYACVYNSVYTCYSDS